VAQEKKDMSTNGDLYARLEATLFERDLSNSENYDKSILMYATGALALSLSFIKDIVPLKDAVYLGFLEVSWLFWICSIFSVLASFVLALKASELQRDLAYRYYHQDDEAAFNEKNKWVKYVKWANIASGSLFVLGAVATMLFVWINIEHDKRILPNEVPHMAAPTPIPAPSHQGYAEDGACVYLRSKRKPLRRLLRHRRLLHRHRDPNDESGFHVAGLE
jgi:hypothetical protein